MKRIQKWSKSKTRRKWRKGSKKRKVRRARGARGEERKGKKKKGRQYRYERGEVPLTPKLRQTILDSVRFRQTRKTLYRLAEQVRGGLKEDCDVKYALRHLSRAAQLIGATGGIRDKEKLINVFKEQFLKDAKRNDCLM